MFQKFLEQTVVLLHRRATPTFSPPLLLLQKDPLGMAVALRSPWLGLSPDGPGPAAFPVLELTATA